MKNYIQKSHNTHRPLRTQEKGLHSITTRNADTFIVAHKIAAAQQLALVVISGKQAFGQRLICAISSCFSFVCYLT